MDYLFTSEIKDWKTWSFVYHSKEVFEPLVKRILEIEKLPVVDLKACKPGTNAVFHVGKYIIKVFAPAESGLNTALDYKTELFSLERAGNLKVSVPKLIAKGKIKDRYLFYYLIMEHVEGIEVSDIRKRLSIEDKKFIGKQLREITDRLNSSCEDFNGIHIKEKALNNKRWDVFPDSFKKERLEYIKSLTLKYMYMAILMRIIF